LERRYCLSAPALTSLEIDSIDDRTVSLSGYVSDESPETVEVDFFGAVIGIATPDASGYFAFSAEADWLGEIEAVAYDEECLSSDSAFVEVTSDVPMIDSLSVEYGEGTEITITGQVIDDGPDGLTVDFTGAVVGTTATDATGYFTFTAADGSGFVDVSVADAWGQDTYDSVEIAGDSLLEITYFSAEMDGGGYITVCGTVSGENLDQARVDISFLDVVDELSLDSEGNFSWYYQCDEGDEGWITAVACDASNNQSDLVEDYLSYMFYE